MSGWESAQPGDDTRTESGLKIFKPQTFALLDGPLDAEAVRQSLREDGVCIISGVLPSNAIEMAKASLENDYRRATTSYLMNEISARMPLRSITHKQLLKGMNSMAGSAQPVPPRGIAPIDGALLEHRLPLTACAQMRRVQPQVRQIFARLYGIEDEEHMVHVPDAARVVLHRHLAESSSSPARLGMSPQKIMQRRLNNTWQPPYRNDSYQGYGQELRRRLGQTAIDFGIMGLICYEDSLCGKPKADRTVSVGPCFVTVPKCKRDSMKRVYTLKEMAGPAAARRQAVRRYQPLLDEELEECMDDFACILPPAGSLLLWRRDMPVAFNSGDRSSAMPEDNKPWKMAYAAQQICWIPRHAQMPNERNRSLSVFRKRSTHTGIYEMRAPTRAQWRRMASGTGVNKRKMIGEDDALNDVPEKFCTLLTIQNYSL